MASWTFITNHGAVLALIGQHHMITAREIAARLDITERSVLRIIKDLEEAGYVTIDRAGRANHYQVDAHLPLRRDEAHDVLIGDLLKVLSPTTEEE
jgi:predicted ArsR family transcriptional regulator